MNYQQALEEVKNYVTQYFKNNPDERYAYHNRNHTLDVVDAAAAIADHYLLGDEDRFIVLAAAWFHDIGHAGLDTETHEERSALTAIDFLREKNIDAAVIDKVRGCIMATKMPQQPETLLESILCDADLFHLGTVDFKRKSKLMRSELEALHKKKISKTEWRENTIHLMEQHQYHTEYGKVTLCTQKENNLLELKGKRKNDKNAPAHSRPNLLPPAHGERMEDYLKKNLEQPTKGVETMFRTTSNNHQRLSDMADSKAHIMISVNALVISLVLSLLLRRLDEHPNQTIPAIALLTVSLVTIIFSILATRPTLPAGTFTEDDVDQKKVNLLFFGNFYRMSLDQYNHGMVNLMHDRDFLYGSMVRDLYSQGIVLSRKYRFLRISYNVFMYGLVASVLSFIIASII